MWFLYALISAIFASFRKINDKQLSHQIHHLHLAWMMRIATIPVLSIALIISGESYPLNQLGTAFWVPFLLSVVVFGPLDTMVYLQSLRYGQLSQTAPIHALWPLPLLIFGALFLSQPLTVYGAAAVCLMCVGVYIISGAAAPRHFFSTLFLDTGMRYTIIGIGTTVVNVLLSVAAVKHSGPLLYAFLVALLGTALQYIYARMYAPKQFNAPLRALLVNGSLQGIASASYFLAIASGPAAYVAAVRSASSVLSSLLAARVFSESLSPRKIVAILCTAIGCTLLVLNG